MTVKVNSVSVTRLGKKRTADAMVGQDSHLQSPAKKSAPLDKISNFSIPKKGKVAKKAVREIEAKFDDSEMCDGYVTDIYDYLHNMEKEAKRRPLQDYMEKVQKDVTANMRGVLVNTIFNPIHFISPSLTLTDSCLLILSISRGYSCLAFLQCRLHQSLKRLILQQLMTSATSQITLTQRKRW